MLSSFVFSICYFETWELKQKLVQKRQIGKKKCTCQNSKFFAKNKLIRSTRVLTHLSGIVLRWQVCADKKYMLLVISICFSETWYLGENSPKKTTWDKKKKTYATNPSLDTAISIDLTHLLLLLRHPSFLEILGRPRGGKHDHGEPIYCPEGKSISSKQAEEVTAAIHQRQEELAPILEEQTAK